MKSYTAAAKKFYTSTVWRRARAAYIQQHGGLCERCLAAGKASLGTVLHHKIYLDDEKLHDPSIALNPENLEVLCQECHNHEHHSKELGTDYRFDDSGELIPAHPDSPL